MRILNRLSILMSYRLSSSGQLLRNFAYLLVGNIGVRLLSFLVMLIVARRLGTEGFGQLNYAQAIVAYFALIADFGISTVSIREFASQQDDEALFLAKTLGTRIILGMIGMSLLGIAVWLLPAFQGEKLLILLFGMNIPSITFSLDWIYRAKERMAPIAVSSLIKTLVTLLLITLFVRSSHQILLIPLFTILGSFVQIAFYWLHFSLHYHLPKIVFDPAFVQRLLSTTMTLGLSYLSIQVYYNVDTILLGIFRSAEEVGLYNAAYRLVMIFTTIAGLIGEAVFPRLSRLAYQQGPVGFEQSKILLLGSKLLIYSILPVVLICTVYSRQIIDLVYTEAFAASKDVLRIIVWQVFTVFANVSFAYNLLANNHQKAYLYSVSIGAGLNIGLNILVIPRYGMIGAAVTTIISEVAVLLLLYFYARRLLAPVSLLGVIPRAALVSSVFLLITLNVGNLFLGTFLGLLSYSVLLFLTQPFSSEEYKRLLPWRTA